MSQRNPDQSIITTLRNIEERLRKLERSHNNSIKRNDIRIGDIVVSAKSDSGLLVAHNVKTNEQTTFAKMGEQAWSFHGVITITGGIEDVGPPYVTPHGLTVKEIVLAFTEPTTALTEVAVTIADKTIMCTIDVGQLTSVTPANVGILANHSIFPTLISTGGSTDHDLTIIARFGLPVYIPEVRFDGDIPIGFEETEPSADPGDIEDEDPEPVDDTDPPTYDSSSSGFAMPVSAPSGMHEVFRDDFSSYGNVPVGRFPADTDGAWGGYAPGTPDTTHHGTYNSLKTISITDGVLDIWVHTEMVNGVQKNWCAAPWPVLRDGRAEIVYGGIEFAFRASEATGFKTAWLFWPDSRQWPRDGEIDYPEGNLDGVGTIHAFMHRQNATVGSDQASRNSGVVYANNVWHKAKIIWMPGQCEFWLDGNKLGITETVRVPNTPMHWIFQTECRLSGGVPPLGSEGHVQLDWVVMWEKD